LDLKAQFSIFVLGLKLYICVVGTIQQ